MANIKELIQSIESPDSSFDDKLAAINQMEETLVAMREQEQEAIDDNVELIIEALKTIEAKVEAKLKIIPEKGEQGIQGQKGEQGDRGLDGAQGRDGKPGIDGKDGLDGKDGISVQDAKIDFDGSLIITLSDGREINVGEVVPVDVAQTIHKIQSGSGGDSQTTLNAIAVLQATIATYGTMATQNANNVAITGGTINGTTVGATTPATGTFTTLTAQTEVIRGTGQNLLTYSNTFSSWTNVAETLTGSQSDPFGGSTATLIVPSVTNTFHLLYSANTPFIAAYPYTLSVYVKASGYNLVYLSDVGVGLFACSYNLSTLAVTPYTGCTGTITAVTGATGWYRITLTTTQAASTTSRFTISGYPTGATLSQFYATFAGDGTSGIVAYGAMAEFGSTANTYIPTTTTAVYGTPTLSFSGVASVGLQSDGSLYVQPAGTGALQAQATTSSATGGNARGANAVDWQTTRNNAAQVASATGSFIGGGFANTSSGGYTVVAGGFGNVSNGTATFVGGGSGNSASGTYATTCGGGNNTSTGIFGFTGGGANNSNTSGSAVTTQSGTMNGTTAVTLSGSNASIKVGQYITGTSIAGDTYVAAISGTSLTLSKNASGSSTSTLSFYTPHGVVVGGGNNQATGSYSFIGGGGDAGTAANRNVASGDWGVVVGGYKNTASGIESSVVSGDNNTASGTRSFIGAGQANIASASGAAVFGGRDNNSNAAFGTIVSGVRGNARGINTYCVFASSAPISETSGGTQAGLLVIARQTTDATATVLASDGAAAGTTNQLILPNNSAYYFKGSVIANVTGGGNTKGWSIEGAIKRGANAASTALVGTPTVTSSYADAGASTWAITATADTTNGGLAITFTGQAGTTIRVVCKLETTEVTY